MPRPRKNRHIKCNPASYYFKPRGIPITELEETALEMDQVEAIRLADFLGLSHEEAAFKMKISRATFGRILEKARYNAADAILHGKALRIETSDNE